MSPFMKSAALFAALWSVPTLAAPALAAPTFAADDPALGADVDGLVAQARTMSPDLAAAALSAEAALRRAEGAGTLPDPTFRVQLKDIDREPGGILPDRLNRIDYTVEQEFPLWGKRDLARSIAGAEAARIAADRDQAGLELVAAVKSAFADYYGAAEAVAVAEDIKRTLDLMADVAQRRYEQGSGTQQDAIMARVEAAHLQTDVVRRQADRARAMARINALLNRPIEAALAAPQALPALPAPETFSLSQLSARLESTPRLKALDATIASASGTQALAQKSWYPDVAVGLSVVDQNRRWQGYEAMVSVKIPLNGTLRRAEIGAATAELGAARNRRDALAAQARQELATAFRDFEEAAAIAQILHEHHIPQSDLAVESAVSGYQQSRIDFLTLLEAQRRAAQNKLEHVSTLVAQHRALAHIEKLVGGAL